MTKDEINDAIIAARVPGKEWKATRMELEERKEIEKKMSIEELYVVAGIIHLYIYIIFKFILNFIYFMY